MRTPSQIFKAAYFITAKTWIQLKFSSTSEWIKILQCIPARGYRNTAQQLKRKEILRYATTRINLKYSYAKWTKPGIDTTYYMIPFICSSKEGETIVI